ncbi:unnamed protein product [Rotaria magnacalcarata]
MKDNSFVFQHRSSNSDGFGAIIGGVVGGVAGAILLCFCCCLVCGTFTGTSIICRGRPIHSNNSYINSGVGIGYNISQSIFKSGIFSSYYYQYRSDHGPFRMQLGFYPEGGYIVHGGGTDDIGTYVITGVYSPRTLRMGLEKRYQVGTGDLNENLGHTVIIHVQWNHENQQFEGKYYLRTRKHRDENKFIIRREGGENYHQYPI